MSTDIIPLHGTHSARASVIGEVRATMARRRISATELGRITGRNQQYWSRRLTGLTAFDVDDLATLSRILRVPIASFFPNDGPEPEGSGDRTSD